MLLPEANCALVGFCRKSKYKKECGIIMRIFNNEISSQFHRLCLIVWIREDGLQPIEFKLIKKIKNG